jgi:hypothetical protein
MLDAALAIAFAATVHLPLYHRCQKVAQHHADEETVLASVDPFKTIESFSSSGDELLLRCSRAT